MILRVPSLKEDGNNDSGFMLAGLSTLVILSLRFGIYKICDITHRNACSSAGQLSAFVITVSINSMPYSFHLKNNGVPTTVPTTVLNIWKEKSILNRHLFVSSVHQY